MLLRQGGDGVDDAGGSNNREDLTSTQGRITMLQVFRGQRLPKPDNVGLPQGQTIGTGRGNANGTSRFSVTLWH